MASAFWFTNPNPEMPITYTSEKRLETLTYDDWQERCDPVI